MVTLRQQFVELEGGTLTVQEDKAKDAKPSKIELIRATCENKTAYVVVTQKHTESINCKVMVVEMHPVLITEKLTSLSITDEFNGTNYYDCLNNRFYLAINIDESMAVFGPRDSITVQSEFQNFGIGSYMFSQLIKWGAQNFPSFRVRKGSLSASDAQRDKGKNKDCRNNFYSNLGFTLEPPDPDDGKFLAANLASLHEHVNWSKITILSGLVQPTVIYPFFDFAAVAKIVSPTN